MSAVVAATIGAAALSSLSSLWGANSSAKTSKAALEAQQQNIAEGKKIVSEGYDDIDDYLDDYKDTLESRKLTDDSTREKYKELINNYDPNDYIAERGTFDKSKYSVDDYIDENKEAIEQAAADKVQRSAAGAGIGRGTGAAQDIAEAVAEKDEELTDKAYERMNEDRNFDYTEFQNQYAANQAALDKLSQGVQTQISTLGGAIQTDQEAEDDYLSDVIAAKTGRVNANVSLLT